MKEYLLKAKKLTLTDIFFDRPAEQFRKMISVKATYTGKSFSEELILVSTNPQYDKRLFMHWTRNSMNNLSSYCGLVDARGAPSTRGAQ